MLFAEKIEYCNKCMFFIVNLNESIIMASRIEGRFDDAKTQILDAAIDSLSFSDSHWSALADSTMGQRRKARHSI